MPLGLWKSKWEIHREDMTRFWAEMDRRHEEFQAQMDRRHEEFQAQMDSRDREFEEEKARRGARDAEYRDERAEADKRWTELQEKSDALRADYNRELAETRLFNSEVLLRMERTYANLNATLVYVGEELAELKAAVNAQTEAIMKLVDRFEEWEKRQLG
ncbi:MAG TPA: hypothetical protein VHS74_05815 [Solirubrobacterales bacterium]|jgi:hypothetical protein|nr:hypothetical protein [Solirubrobacterales bacterium]